jgi:hypothetical protein
MQHIPNNVIESPLTAKIGLPGSEEKVWPLPTNTKNHTKQKETTKHQQLAQEKATRYHSTDILHKLFDDLHHVEK